MHQAGKDPFSTLPREALGALIVLVGGGMLAHLAGGQAWLAAIIVAFSEGSLAGLIVVSAGGYAYPLVNRLAPRTSPRPLRIVTACALGLWMLSTAVLAAGTVATGLLRAWLWWPIIAAGIILAAWQGRRAMEKWRIPKRMDGRTLVWVLVAAAAGLWLAGATRAPGFLNSPDVYDVLEYHLQVPREFYNAQHIGQLQHNCYSYYPLGTEMLSLLAMSLRGGPYQGMYLAKMLHGAFAALAVAAVFVALKRDDEARGRFAAVLLGTVPFAIYLSWLAMAELAEVCYLALALLWLREWLRPEGGDGLRSALCVGLMLGASCAVKYLAVGLVAAPVLAVMFVSGMVKPRRLVHLPAAALAAALLFSPWLIRNAIHTHNPVFPLATKYFGRGHWSPAGEKRWVDGHDPQKKPPVPVPPNWQMPPTPTRLEMLYHNFLASERFGPMVMLLAAVGICALLADPRPNGWDWAMTGVLVVQIAVWAAATNDMPKRFIVPAIVPTALLAAGALARLSRVQVNPFRRASATAARGPWGLPPAVAIFVAAVCINLFIAHQAYLAVTNQQPPVHGVPGERIVSEVPILKDAHELGRQSKILLVGNAQAFYFPPETIYYTAFDADRMAKLLAGGMDRLRRRGITHVWVNWREIVRLAATYGYPASLGAEPFIRWHEEMPPRLELLERLRGQGLRFVKNLPDEPASTAPSTRPVPWPMISIYALGEQAATTSPAGAKQPED